MRRAGVVLLLALAACGEPAPAARHDTTFLDLGRAPAASVHRGSGVAPVATAEEAAMWHAARSGFDTRTLEVARVHDTGRGAIVVQLAQRIGGIEVWRGGLRVVMDRGYALVAIAGDVAAAPPPFAFALDAADAVDRAIRDVKPLRVARPVVTGRRGRFAVVHDADLAEPAHVRPILFALPDRVAPAYLSEVIVDGAALRHVIAADDGRVLYRASLADDAFRFRVWADADATPRDGPHVDLSPHPTGAPDGLAPGFVAPIDVAIDAADPWLPPGATSTVGNNADAYADLDGVDGFSGGDLRATTTAPGAFLHTYDTGADPAASTEQTMAAVTQLFYVVNWLHDFWYESGFDEAAGNAQADNYGRGGAGGDALRVEAQDASGANNANMFTPSDGVSPRMQLFVFDGTPRRDGSIDSQLAAHEWGHYLHHRLVECGGRQCSAMSEGFGDLVALMMTVRDGDDTDGTFAIGTYVAKTLTPEHAYFGIRRYPYSTDLAKNPLTFRHVRNNEPLPPGVPRSDWFDGPNFESHNAGEVWCAMLWEALVDLSEAHGLAAGRRRFADYLVAGMAATPAEPTFTVQRDAILAAIAASDPDDFARVAQAFARRGFGSGAVSPPVGSTSGAGVVESFVLSGALTIDRVDVAEDAASCDGDGVLDVGETGTVTVTLVNTGAGDLAAPTVTLSSTSPGVVFPDGASAA